MPTAVNGFGTMYMGHSSPRLDGSYVTTEWIIALLIPIVPLASYRVIRDYCRDEHVVVASSEGYYVLEKLPMAWTQVATVYALTFAFIAYCVALVWYAATNWSIKDMTVSEAIAGIAMLIAPIATVAAVKSVLDRRSLARQREALAEYDGFEHADK